METFNSPVVGGLVLLIIGMVLLGYKPKDRHIVRTIIGIAALAAGILMFVAATIGWGPFALAVAWVLEVVGNILSWLGNQLLAGASWLRSTWGASA